MEIARVARVARRMLLHARETTSMDDRSLNKKGGFCGTSDGAAFLP